ncbi:MAG: MXAN_6640 family putative metalloprotease [Ignavibacteriaceae bacterium]
MIKKIFITIIVFSFYPIFAQDISKSELDSLYNLYTHFKGIVSSDQLQKQISETHNVAKCGLQLVRNLQENFNSLTFEQQNTLSPLLQRPILETSIVSPNGFFRVHYDLSGINALSYNLELLLQALDSAYSFEINYLGFPTPPTDGSEGGDGKYDIYVQNLSGLYGYTQFENKVAESSWTSFMVIDNDYVGYYSTGIDGAKVTVAHEFHHAIQGGSYAPVGSNSPFRGSDVYYYEITSTSMEEFVQDDVNDYYAYMSTYFQHPENAMPNNDGYNLAIWNIFLQKRFGFDILKNQWELIPTTQAIKAIALSLNDIGSTLGNELNKFGIWTYFTNSRNYFPTLYFEEASEYPLLSTTAEMNFNLSTQTYNMSVNPCANYFLKLNLLPTSDIFYTIVTNSDYQKAIDDPDQFLDFSFTMHNDTINGEKMISENYSVTFSRDNQTFWNNAGIMNNSVVYGDSNYNIPNLNGETYAFPMPFKSSNSPYLKIDFSLDKMIDYEVDLNIYSAGLELVYEKRMLLEAVYIKDSRWFFRIGLNNSDLNSLATGVYIYVVKSGDEVWKGKLVVFNE